jgi:hypothetical protein
MKFAYSIAGCGKPAIKPARQGGRQCAMLWRWSAKGESRHIGAGLGCDERPQARRAPRSATLAAQNPEKAATKQDR